MATIKSSIVSSYTSLTWVRLFAVFLLVACQTAANLSPDAVTATFWRAFLLGDLSAAKVQLTEDSQALLEPQTQKYAFVQVGAMTLDGDTAKVVTVLSQNGKRISFDTVLLKEADVWKIDYQQTRRNIAMLPFQGLAKQLENIGNAVGEQLQQQVPLLEKGLQSFGDELKHQLDDFSHELEKAIPPSKQSNQDTTTDREI